MDSKSEEDYNICSTESGQSFKINFTPPTNGRYCSRNKYISSHMNQTVPRRNPSMIRYRINRSLNFDIGCRGNDNYVSPKSNSKSPYDPSNLSRSAKILKALNIDCSPKNGKKKNKSFRAGLTPYSKRSTKTRRTLDSSLESPDVIKSLNFDDLEDSPIASTHTSLESMDENQNQTPSQVNKKVKKSLSYVSLVSNESGSSFDFNLLSPTGSELRYGLREKIDNIVQTSMTPKMQYSPDNQDNLRNNSQLGSSTPRNLFNDFSDEDEARPGTPENRIRLIPEGISAIKKSHRKERLSGRFVHRIQDHLKPVKMEIEGEEERPSTPPTDICPTPNYSIRSIKKSHKKDKSRRKSGGYRSEDELSDTGSLFDYSTDDKVETIINLKSKQSNDQDSTNSDTKLVEVGADQVPTQTPPRNSRENDASNDVTTPENRIDYLRRIMTDSIKKSHKKIKDSNKKTLFKSRVLEQQIDTMEDNHTVDKEASVSGSMSDDENRATTPDQKNSSRLLLSQFTSVKKSHRKDKHRKTGFAQRHIVMTQEDEQLQVKNEICDESPLTNSIIPQIAVTDASTSKSGSGSSLSTASSTDSHYYSLGTSPLDRNDAELTAMVSSPNKRKNSTTEDIMDKPLISSGSEDHSVDYVTAGEEFKIFTPIKKRKAVAVDSVSRNLNDQPSSSTPERNLLNERCETPKLGLRILTPEQNITNTVENENGRSTPENRGCLARISALSSIKKSHKKDKWAKARRSNLRSRTEESESKEIDINGYPKNLCSHESSVNNARKTNSLEENLESQPSTSHSEGIINSNSPMKTPPNGLRAKAYLRLMQATSIKRSHKKMRQRKQREMHIMDSELSDDGSLFDEVEKSASLDESAIKEKESAESNDIQNHFMPLDNADTNKIENAEMQSRKVGRSKSLRNNRTDGSIFRSDDEINNPKKS